MAAQIDRFRENKENHQNTRSQSGRNHPVQDGMFADKVG
jgi:hypothetical protein